MPFSFSYHLFTTFPAALSLIFLLSSCTAHDSEASSADNGTPGINPVTSEKPYGLEYPPEKAPAVPLPGYDYDPLNPPVISYSDGGLNVIRDGDSLRFTAGDTLLPGDNLETGSRQFAVIQFDKSNSIIIHPSSFVKFSSTGSTLHTLSASIQVDRYSEERLPLIVCFDDTLTHVDSESIQNHSFGMQCRGESGITISSRKGVLRWNCAVQPCDIPAGKGLAGSISATVFEFVDIPEQPDISFTFTADTVPAMQSESRANAFEWPPVTLADRYLAHIFNYSNDRYDDRKIKKHHSLKMLHNNEIEVSGLDSGSYYIRVLAIDFYGVSGQWSDPVPFEL